jgi:hypothetical protein
LTSPKSTQTNDNDDDNNLSDVGNILLDSLDENKSSDDERIVRNPQRNEE